MNIDQLKSTVRFADVQGRSLAEMRRLFSRVAPPASRCPVELRSASVAGRGVFATRAIKAGTICTLYPMHAWWKSDTKRGVWRKVAFTIQKPLEEMQQLIADNTYNMCGEAVSFMGHPGVCENPWLLGHILNDGVSLSVAPGDSADDVARKAIVYTKASMAKRNVDFMPLLCNGEDVACAMVASRDIEEGEELFVSYDSNYWIKQSMGKVDEKLLAHVVMHTSADEECMALAGKLRTPVECC